MPTALAPVPSGAITAPDLPLSDVAARGYACAATLRRRIHEGSLPARRVGNSFRVRLADVERLYPGASGAPSPATKDLEAVVAGVVAAAPPLTGAQIDGVVAAFGDALRSAAGVRNA